MSLETKKKSTRREVFLREMDRVVPWTALEALIEPHYPTGGRRGRPPMALSTMLRIHCLQQWYALSDPAITVTATSANAAQVMTLFALSNLWMKRKTLLAITG